jgi:DNA-binding response OmpR family regulator
MRILLIDDDEDDQTLFCEAVKIISPGAQCEVANNGQEGLLKLNSYSQLPSLVFLDVNMPILDGKETFKIIKSTPRLAGLRVIIYSTSNHQDEMKLFQMMGAGYITKPNSFEELVAVLSRPIHGLSHVAEGRAYSQLAR